MAVQKMEQLSYWKQIVINSVIGFPSLIAAFTTLGIRGWHKRAASGFAFWARMIIFGIPRCWSEWPSIWKCSRQAFAWHMGKSCGSVMTGNRLGQQVNHGN